MACYALLSSSMCLSNGATHLIRGDRSLAPALPSRQAISFRTVSRTVPSLQLRDVSVRAPSSRFTTVQAVEESTSSATGAVATVTEEVKGGTEGGRGSCPGCGKAERVGGCNGEGRIQGGIGAVPGFGWFPIKVFRPCPAFIEIGGRYRRIGQSLEEVAFGRKGTEDDLDISERFKGQK